MAERMRLRSYLCAEDFEPLPTGIQHYFYEFQEIVQQANATGEQRVQVFHWLCTPTPDDMSPIYSSGIHINVPIEGRDGAVIVADIKNIIHNGSLVSDADVTRVAELINELHGLFRSGRDSHIQDAIADFEDFWGYIPDSDALSARIEREFKYKSNLAALPRTGGEITADLRSAVIFDPDDYPLADKLLNELALLKLRGTDFLLEDAVDDLKSFLKQQPASYKFAAGILHGLERLNTTVGEYRNAGEIVFIVKELIHRTRLNAQQDVDNIMNLLTELRLLAEGGEDPLAQGAIDVMLQLEDWIEDPQALSAWQQIDVQRNLRPIGVPPRPVHARTLSKVEEVRHITDEFVDLVWQVEVDPSKEHDVSARLDLLGDQIAGIVLAASDEEGKEMVDEILKARLRLPHPMMGPAAEGLRRLLS